MNDLLTAFRNDFQSRVSAKEITDIERKFLDTSKRTRDEPVMKAISPEERLTYAEYLESKNQLVSAKAFRDYVDEAAPKRTKKGKAVKVKLETVELYLLSGKLFRKLEVEKQIAFIITKDKFFVQGSGKNKKRFYERTEKWNLADDDERVARFDTV